ncbi:MAG: phosphoribosyl-AMP cyclohydrolase / phosphoribosyl-ATP pyrophosphohydrolase [Candidatus Sumerlaeota bacterium]|nr:phosphoribosyl-AMP cyclohydrolase / phosphoribosyl-ATP pyrophosphohydrolase [Candidatus Sumerlaeota bacterium]
MGDTTIRPEIQSLIDQVKFDDKGLVPCICQDAATGEVLMFAFMNRESLGITLERGLACYYSRSRGKLWLKGESSGHTQKIKDIRLDCDADCLLIKVEQQGAACHTGYRSCFYRHRDAADTWAPDGEPLFSQNEMDAKYGKK